MSGLVFTRLLASARRGNRRAQGELFGRYYPLVQRVAHARLRRHNGGRATALAARFSTADVVQEVFGALVTRLEHFRGSSEGEFVRYVTRAVQGHVLDSLRFHGAECRDFRLQSGRLEALRGTRREPVVSAEAPEAAETAELVRGYRQALVGFPTRTRELLAARIERGLTFAEIARQLGYSSRYKARRAFSEARARLALEVAS